MCMVLNTSAEKLLRSRFSDTLVPFEEPFSHVLNFALGRVISLNLCLRPSCYSTFSLHLSLKQVWRLIEDASG